MAVTLSDLLKKMLEMGGSDLHITTNSPPQIRVHGHLNPLDMPPLTAPETKQLAYSVLTDAQKHRFEENLELDFSFGLKGLARFRGNCFNQRGAVGAVFRVIPFEIKSFQQLGLPPVVVGLVVYLFLSRSGPLGFMSLLYTPGAMIIAQSIIAFPLVAGFTMAAVMGVDPSTRR